MKRELFEKLYQELLKVSVDSYDFVNKELVEITIPCNEKYVSFVDGNLLVSNDNGPEYCDYYGEFRGGYPWIEPKLEAWAKSHGYYWEWRDPGSIMLIVS